MQKVIQTWIYMILLITILQTANPVCNSYSAAQVPGGEEGAGGKARPGEGLRSGGTPAETPGRAERPENGDG